MFFASFTGYFTKLASGFGELLIDAFCLTRVACQNCCKFALALYPDLTQSSKDKYLLPVIHSSLMFIMMQTANLKSD
jgi:hypothetical protein